MYVKAAEFCKIIVQELTPFGKALRRFQTYLIV